MYCIFPCLKDLKFSVKTKLNLFFSLPLFVDLQISEIQIMTPRKYYLTCCSILKYHTILTDIAIILWVHRTNYHKGNMPTYKKIESFKSV